MFDFYADRGEDAGFCQTGRLSKITIDERAFPIRGRDPQVRELIRVDRIVAIRAVIEESKEDNDGIDIMTDGPAPSGPYAIHISSLGPNIMLKIGTEDGQEILNIAIERQSITRATTLSYQAFMEGVDEKNRDGMAQASRTYMFDQQRAGLHVNHAMDLLYDLKDGGMSASIFVVKKLFTLLTILVDKDHGATMGMQPTHGGKFGPIPR